MNAWLMLMLEVCDESGISPLSVTRTLQDEASDSFEVAPIIIDTSENPFSGSSSPINIASPHRIISPSRSRNNYNNNNKSNNQEVSQSRSRSHSGGGGYVGTRHNRSDSSSHSSSLPSPSAISYNNKVIS